MLGDLEREFLAEGAKIVGSHSREIADDLGLILETLIQQKDQTVIIVVKIRPPRELPHLVFFVRGELDEQF